MKRTINESQLRELIRESIFNTIKDLAFDKTYGSQNRQEFMSNNKFYVFTGTTRQGYERHWCGTEDELQNKIDFYHIQKDSIGKIAGPFSYRKAAWDYCEKNGINTPQPGDNVRSEWSPEKKAEQEKIEAEIAVRNELERAAKKSACTLFYNVSAGKVGFFKPSETFTLSRKDIANDMMQHLSSSEAKKKLSTYLKTGGKEKDVSNAIYAGFMYAKNRLKLLQARGY